MANETISTSSFTSPKPQEKFEGCENVPPASLLGETCPATSTPCQNVKGKSPLSGLQSALTPILKYLNIGNKSNSLISSNDTTKSSTVSVFPVGKNKDSYAYTVLNDSLPEITLLDTTCNSTLNMTNTQQQFDSDHGTPVFLKELKKPMQVLDVNLKSKLRLTMPPMTPVQWLHDEVLPEMSLFDDTCDSTINLTRLDSELLNSVPSTPFCQTDMLENTAEKNQDNKPNLTLAVEKSSLVAVKKEMTFETTHDGTSQKRPSLESNEMVPAKAAKLEISQSSLEKMSTPFNCNLTHSINSSSGISDSLVEDAKKVQLQVTQDVSMSSTLDGSKSSLKNCTQTIDEVQPVTKAHQINITHDLSTSNASVRSEVSQSSGCNSNKVTFELEASPVKTFPGQSLSCVSENKIGNNQGTGVSLNGTFTPVQDIAARQASIQQNQTLDFSTSNSYPPMIDNQNTHVSSKQITPESSLVMNNSSNSKSSQSCEKDSLQKSSGSTIVAQASATSTYLQNAFESKPNETITPKGTTMMGDKSQQARDRSSPSPVQNEISAGSNLPVMSGEKLATSTVSDEKPAELRDNTFNVNGAAEEHFGSTSGDVKDSLNNGVALYESIVNDNTEGRRVSVFNLDSTLEFKSDPLVTSTPMAINKSFNFTAEHEEGKTIAAQKMLYREGPSKSSASVFSAVPSNIVCDRKTFLHQPATKPMLSLKPPSLLSKFKPASLLPKRPDLLTSSQSTNRQIEAPKTNTAQIFQQTTEMPNCFNLRATADAASALKPSVPGLRKTANMPSGFQRTGQSLKPLQAKGVSAAPSGSDKPAGGTNIAKTSLPVKKHPLPKPEALPAAKKKKMDNPVPSHKVEAPASSSDTNSKAKTLKIPSHNQRTLPTKPLKHDSLVPSLGASSDSAAACETATRVRSLRPRPATLKASTTKPQCHDCANCTLLEARLQQKDKEIRILKEELLKK